MGGMDGGVRIRVVVFAFWENLLILFEYDGQTNEDY
jgi:hypothetical protein